MRRWLIPVTLLSATIPGWATFSRGETTYQLDVTLLREASPDGPETETPRRLATFSVRAGEGREVRYESGGVVTFDGEHVPIGQSLRAVIRRESKGRVHLRLVLEN
jgi:hypothetical protein